MKRTANYRKTGNNKNRRRKNRSGIFRLFLLIFSGILAGGYEYSREGNLDQIWELVEQAGDCISDSLGGRGRIYGTASVALDSIPEYSGEPYVVIDNHIPDFTDEERSSGPFEYYSELDDLGRCGMAEAMISRELMPTEERESIGQVRPSGWHTVKYDSVDGMYLYNRCHLIAFALAGENANEKNLITGTRYMNAEGMLPWETMVLQYVRRTGDKVLYRVTPVFEGDNLLASGVQMEAESIGTDEIQFNVYVYNVQPGISIDYSDGNSWEN